MINLSHVSFEDEFESRKIKFYFTSFAVTKILISEIHLNKDFFPRYASTFLMIN